MGNCCLPIRFRRTTPGRHPKSITLLLLGLDNAGKTTIAKRLAGEPVDSVVPTVGFSVVLLRQKACHVALYDLGGGPQIRDIWHRYFADAHGIIFVTDARDIQRMEECRQVLHDVLQHEQVSGKPVLLLANKQDLDGAVDEIDLVESLDLERLVNRQKCPTLVELCSATAFAKRMDLGIENGYRWLLRSIVRDFPLLNSRVARDLAKQKEENKVEVVKKRRNEEKEKGREGQVNGMETSFSFIPVARVLEEKGHLNGIIKPGMKSHLVQLPGTVEDVPDNMKRRKKDVQRFHEEEIVSVLESRPNSGPLTQSSQFFVPDQFQSDQELLNNVPNHTFKNFLVRPKSSGARLYGVKSEKKRTTQRRKPLRKGNKTGPTPFTDISKESKTNVSRRRTSLENVNPFVMATEGVRSVPGSRRGSEGFGRRHSTVNGKVEVSPLKVRSRRTVGRGEIILNVKSLENQ